MLRQNCLTSITAKRSRGMRGQGEGETCIFCKGARLIERNEEIAFRQWTDKGYVRCLVTIPMRICPQCGGKIWDAAAEAALDEAVRQEYDKLA